ncbi:MAG: FG-GAP-like repeat-containing protein, partial [Flavobacteriales bacterium]
PINNNAYIDWTTVSDMPAGDMSGNYGSCFTDFDNDGDLDLYISHCRQGVNDPGDARRWNRLFVNDGNNNYTDQAAAYGVQDHEQTWTTDFGDFDNDGDLDMVSTEHSTTIKLFLNDGTGHFTDVTAGSGLDGTTGFMLQGMFRDLDNDGHLDILIAGGIQRYFKGNGDGTFTQVNGVFPSSTDMHGFAFGDLNRDGFEDVYSNYGSNYVDPSSSTADRLWLNTPNGNHFFRVRLEGTVSNRDAIGAKVTITGPWGTQVREVRSGESYGMVNSFILPFGLGSATMVSTMTVRWPAGTTETFTNLHADQTMTVVEGTCISPNVGIDASPSDILCTGGGPITLTADLGYTYAWNTGVTTQSISVSTPGAYWTMVSGTGDCVTQANVNVRLDPDQTPTVAHIGNGNICSQDQLVLTSSSPDNNVWSTGSTAQSITVNSAGNYSVAVQGACANFISDTVTVTVSATPAQPVTADVTIPVPGTAVLSAFGDSIAWYDAQTGGDLVGTGSPWTTPFLSDFTTYWCADVAHYGSDPVHGGKVDKSTSGAYQNNANYYLYFNTTQDMMIHSVKVYANGAGDRQIGIIDQSSGDVVDTGTYYIPDGESVVVLDLMAPGGGSYGLRVMTGDPQLWRDAVGSNPVFPYALGSLGSITGSNAGSAAYYYYFYDWEVSAPGTYCPSPRASATVLIGQVGIDENASSADLRIFPNPATDQLTILGDLPQGKVDVTVLDVAGRSVMSTHVDETLRSVDISTLAPGSYTLKMHSTIRTSTARFVKQ